MPKDTISKYQNGYQITSHEIKELKEKVKGNMSLLEVREIIWNDIINKVKNVWEFMSIVEEEKSIVRDLESIITTSKQNVLQHAKFSKNMYDFINYNSSQELREMQIEDGLELLLEINKMVLKILYRQNTETKMGEIKEYILKFNTNFDKRTKAILPSCWD